MPFPDDQNSLWLWDPSDIAGTRRPGFNIGVMGQPRGAMLLWEHQLFASKADLLAKFREMKAAILADPNALEACRGEFQPQLAPRNEVPAR